MSQSRKLFLLEEIEINYEALTLFGERVRIYEANDLIDADELQQMKLFLESLHRERENLLEALQELEEEEEN